MYPVTDVDFSILFMLNMVVGALITWLVTAPVVEMISHSGFVRPNFKGESIPVGVGFIFLLVVIGGLTIDYLFLPGLLGQGAMLMLMGLAVITFLGLVDDFLGSRDYSGLRGHLKALLKGKLTTGGLKAVGGGVLALLITLAYLRPETWTFSVALDIIVSTLIMALSINTINLLDLRPGRAAKGFLLLAVIFSALLWGSDNILPLALIMGSLVLYLPWDLKARVMMGDTGSNALGLVIGMVAALSLQGAVKLFYLLFLVLFHVLTEKYSLTQLIANNKILNYLDQLGRK